MKTYVPHPTLLDSLCKTYGQHNRADIAAAYGNAHLAWRDVPASVIDSIPELITARAFRVRSIYARTAEERAWANYMESLLIHPYRQHS